MIKSPQGVVVFTLDGEAWRVYLRAARRVLPTEWNSKGAALAGAQVELRRIANNPSAIRRLK